MSDIDYFAEVWKGDPIADKVLARIAELEAEVRHQVERREEEKLRAISAEAERDALRDRRCDGCANWDPDEHTYGWCETVLDEDNPIATRPDFACSRWQPREGDEAV